MAQKNKYYKCDICGNIVLVTHEGQGELYCCGQPMTLLEEKTTDEGREKHVPVIQNEEGGTRVRVGSVPHPMQEEHYIEWIEATSGDKVLIKYLSPGQEPEAFFPLERVDRVRAYCNIHGLWGS